MAVVPEPLLARRHYHRSWDGTPVPSSARKLPPDYKGALEKIGSKWIDATNKMPIDRAFGHHHVPQHSVKSFQHMFGRHSPTAKGGLAVCYEVKRSLSPLDLYATMIGDPHVYKGSVYADHLKSRGALLSPAQMGLILGTESWWHELLHPDYSTAMLFLDADGDVRVMYANFTYVGWQFRTSQFGRGCRVQPGIRFLVRNDATV